MEEYRFLLNALTPTLGPREARATAFLILEEAFGLSKTAVYIGEDKHFSANDRARLENIALRVQQGEPVQYVLGFANFDGLRLRVAPAVLIPRPETEELVRLIAAREAPHAILDAGTGSGCIAIALKRRFPQADIEAWDISADALALAAANAAAEHAAVDFRRVDMLAADAAPRVSDYVLVSNPPYVRQSERADMQPQVLLHEPELALFVPDADALRFYRALAALAARSDCRAVYLEINREFPDETAVFFKNIGFETEVLKDAFDNFRFVCARRPK